MGGRKRAGRGGFSDGDGDEDRIEPLRRDAGALALAGKGGYAVRIGGRSAKCGLIIPT